MQEFYKQRIVEEGILLARSEVLLFGRLVSLSAAPQRGSDGKAPVLHFVVLPRVIYI